MARLLRRIRRRKRWTQAALRARLGISQSELSRRERHDLGTCTLDELDAWTSALGARLTIELRVEGERPLTDERHARLQDWLVGRLRESGWIVEAEVSLNHYGDRGRIDVLAYHPTARVVLVIKVKSRIEDVQDLLGRLDIKMRIARILAEDRGWDAKRLHTRHRRRRGAHRPTARSDTPVAVRGLPAARPPGDGVAASTERATTARPAPDGVDGALRGCHTPPRPDVAAVMMEQATAVREGEVLSAISVQELDRQFEVHRPGLVRLCASMVGADDADDIVQDTYMVARRRLAQLQDPAALGSWLKRIAVNRCYDGHRRRRRLIERLPLLHRSIAHSQRDLSLVELIDRLPARQRTVLVLHYAHGYALNEIAELLSLSHVNVRTIIARTRRSLLEAWKEADA